MGFLDIIKDAIGFGNTLYFPGCLTKIVSPDLEKNYIEILNMIGLDFILIPEFYCCGRPAADAGYKNIADKLSEKNMEAFKNYGVTRIITNCPSCYREFKKMGIFKVEHVTEVLAKHLSRLQTFQESDITYQDPCNLGRGSGIYEAPREVLKSLGFNIVEPENNKENAMCCGACGGLKTNHPELSSRIAKKYLKTIKTKKVVTTCPLCYKHLKENSDRGVEIYELSQVILHKI